MTAFDTAKRLTTWEQNEKNWKAEKRNFVEQKAEKQNTELKKNKNAIDPKELF